MSTPRRAASGSYADKLWRDALRKAVLERVAKGQPQRLERIARAVAEKAETGDIAAAKEIGDRLDGKVPQIIGGDEQNPLRMITKIERIVVRPGNPNR